MSNDLMLRAAMLFSQHETLMATNPDYREEFQVREHARAVGDISVYWEWHRKKYNPTAKGWGNAWRS